jgi:hypothetical protein
MRGLGWLVAKVRGKPFAEIFCLADVEHLIGAIEHPIDARQFGHVASRDLASKGSVITVMRVRGSRRLK